MMMMMMVMMVMMVMMMMMPLAMMRVVMMCTAMALRFSWSLWQGVAMIATGVVKCYSMHVMVCVDILLCPYLDLGKWCVYYSIKAG
jgi:hypothetical protein